MSSLETALTQQGGALGWAAQVSVGTLLSHLRHIVLAAKLISWHLLPDFKLILTLKKLSLLTIPITFRKSKRFGILCHRTLTANSSIGEIQFTTIAFPICLYSCRRIWFRIGGTTSSARGFWGKIHVIALDASPITRLNVFRCWFRLPAFWARIFVTIYQEVTGVAHPIS